MIAALLSLLPVGSLPARILGGPWGKLVIYGIVIASLALGARWWMNAHDDRVVAANNINLVKQLQKESEAQTKARLKELSEIRVSVSMSADDTRKQIESLRVSLAQAMVSLRNLNEEMKTPRIEYVEKACSLPASDLAPAIVAVSDAIASLRH